MNVLYLSVLGVFFFMSLVYVLALLQHDNGLVDVAWGLGFILIAFTGAVAGGASQPRQHLLLGMTLVWGLRLATHILLRNRARQGEDFRYRAWREAWGRWFALRSFLQIYMLQGAVMLVVAAPLLAVNAAPGPRRLGPLDGAGVMLWALGLLFEAVGDWQLLRFKSDPANAGRIMTRGLWRCTRHPNYFGEAVLWWGMFLVALASPYGGWAIVGPLTLGFLLLRVSGVPMLEQRYAGNAEFEKYRARTPAFFPWFPRPQR